MKNDLMIKINGLSDEISLQVVEKMKSLISTFSYLDLRRFSKIIITSYFDRDIEVLTTQKNSVFKNRYKANSNTFALVLTLPKDDGFELVLVMKNEFIKNILKRPQDIEYKEALHILNHELAHIHDNNKKIDNFEKFMKKNSYKGVDSVTYPIAEKCWSEYIANMISSTSAKDTQYPKLIAQNFLKMLEDTSININTQLMAYKINKDREDLLVDCITKLEQLLKQASYLLGYLDGLGITLEELDYEVDYALEISYFKDIWEVMKFELNSMKEVYPDGFINLNIYKKLSFFIETFFCQMGIVLMEDKEKKLIIKIM